MTNYGWVQVLCAGMLIFYLVCFCDAWSRSSTRSGKQFSHDVKTKSGTTKIYNQKVTKVEHVTRPMGSSGGSAKIPFVHHHGTVVTTNTGNRYLVHKGDGYGKSSQTVVTDARHMSGKWRTTETRSVQGHTVSDFVKAGGAKYKLATDNCIHSANRMTRLGRK